MTDYGRPVAAPTGAPAMSGASERHVHPGAVALAYSEGDAAPRVVAKGRGLVADEIIRRAREAGVYVHESPELMGLLMQVDLDRHIPPSLYLVVAELLAWLYRMEQTAQQRHAGTSRNEPNLGAGT